MGGYKGEGKHTYKSKLLVTSHVRKMVVVVVVVVGWRGELEEVWATGLRDMGSALSERILAKSAQK